jgi:hypothetical protein
MFLSAKYLLNQNLNIIQVAAAGETQWILPMLYFDMGPNNLFRLLRQGAITAYNMGRGLTVPVFHR